jgi:hypothetical protein
MSDQEAASLDIALLGTAVESSLSKAIKGIHLEDQR